MRRWIFILELFIFIEVLLCASSWARTLGMVIRVDQDQVTINLGSLKNTRPDQELFINRLGVPVGKIRVVLVDQYSSLAKVIKLEEGQSIRIGDLVCDEALEPPSTPGPREPEPAAQRSSSSEAGAPARGDAAKAYAEMLKERIKVATFKSSPRGEIRVNAGDISLILGVLASASYGYIDPWMIGYVMMDKFSGYNASRSLGTSSALYIGVTYYDESLMESQARYFVQREMLSDPARIEEIKQSLMQQMDMGNYVVFHVKMTNQGSSMVQLSPFRWHMYLIDSGGGKIKIEKYDDLLDKALNPRSETSGYVYFPRRGGDGRLLTLAKPVKVVLEDVLGGRTELTWK